MKRNDNDTANKVDVILSGQETFGSAERETDKECNERKIQHDNGWCLQK